MTNQEILDAYIEKLTRYKYPGSDITGWRAIEILKEVLEENE